MIEINNIYTVGDGYYSGEKILLIWINKFKGITMGNRRFTQGHGKLINGNRRINIIVEFLDYKAKENYSKLSKIELIKRIKNKDLKAKKEFIIRYRKAPKF